MSKKNTGKKSAGESTEDKTDYRFRAEDFYSKLREQNNKCPLTGRELEADNTTAEHIKPLSKGGEHKIDNIYLVDKEVAKLKRTMHDEEVVELAAAIIQTVGADFGYGIKKLKRP